MAAATRPTDGDEQVLLSVLRNRSETRIGIQGREMVTNYPQRLTATATPAPDEDESAASSVMTRIVEAIRQTMCGLRGHDSVLHFEHRRVLLRCTTCGHDSPGWEISGQPPRQVFGGDAERHLLRPQLQLRRTA